MRYNGCSPYGLLVDSARFLQKPEIECQHTNVGLVRLADIYIFSCEGPVWIILLFKQLFICVHFYQLCQAEELL